MKICAKLKESFLIALFNEFLFVIYIIMKTAIQDGHTVLSWIIEIHKLFSITFVFVGELLSGIIGMIFLIGTIIILDIVVLTIVI